MLLKLPIWLKDAKLPSPAWVIATSLPVPTISPTMPLPSSVCAKAPFRALSHVQTRLAQQSLFLQDGIGNRRQQGIDLFEVANGVEVD